MKKIICIILLSFLVLSGCESKELAKSEFYQYNYEKMEDVEKEAYLQMYTAILNHEESVTLKGIEKETIQDLYVKVRNDHPELFWMDNKYSLSSSFGGNVMEVKFSYLLDKDDAENAKAKIEKVKDEFIAQLHPESSDVQKIRAAYEFVIHRCEYVADSENDQNIQSVFIANESVCAGYARALQYLLLNMDIPCGYIEGYSTAENTKIRHAWNVVQVDKDWYYIDATWGDKTGEITHVCDAYFLMNSDEMLKAYEPSTSYEKTKDKKLNWCKEKGNYVEKWNASQIQKLWKDAKASNVRYIEMKCAENVYEDMVERIKKGEMYEILRQMGMFVDRIWYVKNDALNMIEVFY